MNESARISRFAQLLLLSLVSVQLQSLPLEAANPISHDLVKRANVDCLPTSPTTELTFEDCVTAIFDIWAGKTVAQRNAYQYFGPTIGADVRFNSLQWSFGMGTNPTISATSKNAADRSEGTCSIQMVPENNYDQVASWAMIVTTALRIARQCVHDLTPSRQGNSYLGQSQPRSDPAASKPPKKTDDSILRSPAV